MQRVYRLQIQSQPMLITLIKCILQDHKGFMWFGTDDVLNKYDGYKFTVYRNDSQNTGVQNMNVSKGQTDGVLYLPVNK